MYLCGGFVHVDWASWSHDGLWLGVGCRLNGLKGMDGEGIEELVCEYEWRLSI